jgi:hypothetical protein
MLRTWQYVSGNDGGGAPWCRGKSARFSAASWAKLGGSCAMALVMGEDCCAGSSNARFLVCADPEGWRISA